MQKTTFLLPLFTAAALLAQSGTASNPQSPATHDGGSRHTGQNAGRHGMGRLSQELNLTPEQQRQVRSFFEQAKEAAKPVRDQLREQRGALEAAVKANSEQQIEQVTHQNADLEAQLQAIHAKTMAKVYSILNAEQKTKFDAVHSRTGRARWHGGRNG